VRFVCANVLGPSILSLIGGLAFVLFCGLHFCLPG